MNSFDTTTLASLLTDSPAMKGRVKLGLAKFNEHGALGGHPGSQLWDDQEEDSNDRNDDVNPLAASSSSSSSSGSTAASSSSPRDPCWRKKKRSNLIRHVMKDERQLVQQLYVLSNGDEDRVELLHKRIVESKFFANCESHSLRGAIVETIKMGFTLKGVSLKKGGTLRAHA